MLGKLLKYEIPALGRKLVPLYAAWAATAVFMGIMIGPAQGEGGFMMVLSALLYFSVAVAIFVMSVIMIIQRYNNSLLGEEAYFNMVLPVKASDHIANKLISAMIWILLTGIVAIGTALIIGLFAGAMYGLNIDWSLLADHITGREILLFVEILILFFLSLVKTVLQIYTAITIGHQAGQHTTLASIGAYIGVMIFESAIGRIFALFFPAIMDQTSQISDFGQVQLLFVPAMIVSLVLVAVYFIVCKVLMEKRLNLN